MQDQTPEPIYYKRNGLNTEPQIDSRQVTLLRNRITNNMRRLLVHHADAKQVECVSFDSTDPSFTVIYLSFTSVHHMLWYLAKQIADGLANEDGIELYELTALTNLGTTDLNRYRVKLVIDQEKYL